MFKKRYLFIIMLVCLFAVSAVSAEDNLTNDIVSVSNDVNSLEVNSNMNSIVNDTDTLKVSNDEVLTAGNNWYVNGSKNSSGDGKSEASAFKTLNEAINSATNDDTIMIASGEYKGTYNTGLSISKNLNFIKYGAGEAIFDAESQRRIWTITATSINIIGLTFKNGIGDKYPWEHGGAIALYNVDGSGSVTNCTFTGNTAEFGGAIYFNNECNVTNCIFTYNTAEFGGAISFGNGGSVTNCTFTNNIADYDGGAISFGNGGSVTNCIFTNNTATNQSGGAIYLGFGGDVTNSTFNNNKATGGSAIYFSNGGSGSVTNCTFTNNIADYDGGAIFFYENGGVTDCTFTNNTAKGRGGAIMFFSGGSVTNCTFTNNTSKSEFEGGGALYFNNECNVTNCIFTLNKANFGGAISGKGNVTNCIFTNNTARNDGGAISFGEGNVTNCIFTYNTAGANGGAICCNEYTSVTNCFFTYNTANDGGAIYIYGGAPYLIVIRDSIFTNNNKNTIYVQSQYIDIVTCLDNTTGNVTVTACNITYNATIVNGNATIFAPGVILDINSYFKDKKYTYTTLQFSFSAVIIDAPDVTKYYGGSERFAVTLKDLNAKPIANAHVKITINGKTYTKTTDGNGETSIGINLNSGVYNVTTKYNERTKVRSTVSIKDTVIAKDVTKIYRNGTQYQGTFVDSKGNLVKNTEIQININGVFYKRTTDANGMAQMNINLPPGTYILTAINPSSGEQHTTTVTVLPNIVENYDLTKYYKNASQYSLRLLDDKGNPVGAGVSIQLNINGVFYTRTSDANGYVKMNINLPPGTYIITAEYKGLRASNTIKVLSVLETKDLVMKYKDGSKFEAKVLDGQGKPYTGQTVTFNINGVFYTKTTEADGIARLKINLLAGEYIITSMYNGLNSANKVTISG